MEQNNTPLYTAMKKYIEDKAMAFHTPGHKQGKGAANELHEMITDTGLKMEVSLMEEYTWSFYLYKTGTRFGK